MEHIKFKYMSTGEKIFTIVDYILMIFVLVVIAYPIIYIISASFSSPQAVISGKVVLWPVDVTLRGYKAVFNNPKIMTGFRNSIFYTVVGTFINIVMTMCCAFPLSEGIHGAEQDLRLFRLHHVLQRRTGPHVHPRDETRPDQFPLGHDHSDRHVHLQHDHRPHLYGQFDPG
jgi:hypothetical protein